jgi:hypothetical protein
VETGIPSSHNILAPAVRRQVVARQPAMRRQRRPRPGRLLFLIFITAFLLLVLGLILQG